MAIDLKGWEFYVSSTLVTNMCFLVESIYLHKKIVHTDD